MQQLVTVFYHLHAACHVATYMSMNGCMCVCVSLCVGLSQNIIMIIILAIHLNSIVENFTITPSEVVQRIGDRAEINCELRGSPTAVINWGVGKLASFQFILPDNRTSIKVSGDRGRTLIFDPVSQGQEGNYYCWVALSEIESVYSKVVPLTILRKLYIIVILSCNSIEFMIYR